MADRSMFDRLHKALEVVRSHKGNNTIQKGKKILEAKNKL